VLPENGTIPYLKADRGKKKQKKEHPK